MAGTQTLDYPDTADPLAHATVQRRLWAAYLRRGYNRSTFAAALGVRMQTVWQWDTEKSIPTLELFKRACELVGYTMDELAHGHVRSEPRAAEPDLSDAAVKALLDSLGATDAQRNALGEHAASPAARFQRLSRTYVSTFVASYAAAIQVGVRHLNAIATAAIDAANARAAADALALGARPVSPERVEELGAEILATLAKPAKPKPAKRKRKR